MNGAVLDASAVLALLHDEPGAELVAACADGAILHPINLAEVFTVVRRQADKAGASEHDATVDTDSALHSILGMGIETRFCTFTDKDAATAAELATSAPGLSLGDRCCLAITAEVPRGYAVTADQAWSRIPTDALAAAGIEHIQLIRNSDTDTRQQDPAEERSDER